MNLAESLKHERPAYNLNQQKSKKFDVLFWFLFPVFTKLKHSTNCCVKLACIKKCNDLKTQENVNKKTPEYNKEILRLLTPSKKEYHLKANVNIQAIIKSSHLRCK